MKGQKMYGWQVKEVVNECLEALDNPEFFTKFGSQQLALETSKFYNALLKTKIQKEWEFEWFLEEVEDEDQRFHLELCGIFATNPQKDQYQAIANFFVTYVLPYVYPDYTLDLIL